jgi:hypothetical protein
MSVFNGAQKLISSIKTSLILTILFAGSWCLSQTSDNLFWLSISIGTYIKHILIWISVCLSVFFIIQKIGKRKPDLQTRIIFIFWVLSLINIMDYGMRSIFGAVSKWPITVLICWSVITLLLPGLATILGLKVKISRSLMEKIINVSILPCVLFIYYALPTDFTILETEKPLRKGSRPPVHLILFDMLSYDFLYQDGEIKPGYKNFKSFSNAANVYLNAYSLSSTTGQVIPRLLTGIDFEKIGHKGGIWQVQEKNSSKIDKISSYQSIFSLSDAAGYNVFLRAFALPYLNNFHTHIQSGEVYPYNTLWRSGMHSLIWPILNPGGIQHQKTTVSILDDYLRRIIDAPDNTLFYLHWNIPHDPFIYDSSGQMMSRLELTEHLISGSDRRMMYEQQLAGTDQILGSIIQKIMQSGTYDESLIIVTSDHNIKGFGFEMKHIPLIIKWPHQNKTAKVFSKVTSSDIFNMLKVFIQSQIG